MCCCMNDRKGSYGSVNFSVKNENVSVIVCACTNLGNTLVAAREIKTLLLEEYWVPFKLRAILLVSLLRTVQ